MTSRPGRGADLAPSAPRLHGVPGGSGLLRPAALRTVGLVSAVALVLVLLVATVLPGPVAGAGPLLLLVAALIGVPHGAADLALLPRGGTGRHRPVFIAAGYALLAAISVGACLLFPGPSLATLLVLSVLHFAEGEVGFNRLRGDAAGARAAGSAIGLLVVAGPVVRWPAQAGRLLAELSPVTAAVVTAPAAQVLLAVLCLAAVVGALLLCSTRLRVEVTLVAVAALALPPLVFFAVWFAAWHAPRHLARVGTTRALAPVLRLALAPSAAAIVLLLAMAPVLGSVAASVLLVLLALTVPHAVVVGRVLSRPPAEGTRLQG